MPSSNADSPSAPIVGAYVVSNEELAARGLYEASITRW